MAKAKLVHEDVLSWEVLCWGACKTIGEPCYIRYLSTEDGKEKKAKTGAVIEDIDPESVKANDYVEAGILAPIEWKKGKAP